MGVWATMRHSHCSVITNYNNKAKLNIKKRIYNTLYRAEQNMYVYIYIYCIYFQILYAVWPSALLLIFFTFITLPSDTL